MLDSIVSVKDVFLDSIKNLSPSRNKKGEHLSLVDENTERRVDVTHNKQTFEQKLKIIADKYNCKYLTDSSDLTIDGGHIGESTRGLALGVLDEFVHVPKSAIKLAPSYLINVMKVKLLKVMDRLPESPGYVYLVPGYLAINKHLIYLNENLKGCGKIVHTHKEYDQPIINRNVIEDANMIAENIINGGHPTTILAHSRGGLVSLCCFRVLQDRGFDHLVEKMVLMSPISNGMRTELKPFAKVASTILRVKEVDQFLKTSPEVEFWQPLSKENRKKVVVISQEGGDAFTSPRFSFVEGGKMILTPHCGHQSSVRDPKKKYFKVVIDVCLAENLKQKRRWRYSRMRLNPETMRK